MNIAYFMNTYPITSTTFIRREIHAHEKSGLPITRFAIRHWDGDLVEGADIVEREKTEYLLSGNKAGLIGAFVTEMVTNPIGMFRASAMLVKFIKTARGGLVRHIAYLLEAASLKRRANRKNIDHIHVHFSTNATAAALLSKRLGGPTYSFTVHGPDELTDAPLLSLPEKIAEASFVAAISSYCKSQLIRFSSIEYEQKIKIIHCGIELEKLASTRLPSNQTFVCVGRLCPQKGQSQIPAAAAALKEEFPALRIRLVGDGELRSDIEKEIAAHSVKDHVEIVGWLSNDGVQREIRSARVFLLPSYAEGLPVVIMEAMALGRPVISTFIAGIPELLDDDAGWIIPAGDRDALVNAMRQALLATTEELEKKASTGQARVGHSHDINQETAKLRREFQHAAS